MSYRMVYMDRSPTCTSSVPLVFNAATGSIIPQFHIVVDNWFTTFLVMELSYLTSAPLLVLSFLTNQDFSTQ